MTDWLTWHEQYDDPGSSLSHRLDVVRRFIDKALTEMPAGPIRVVSMCAGDGRDLLNVLASHPRRENVSGRLVELNPQLAEQARAAAPPGIEVLRGDAGLSDSYAGAAPADLLLACGIFGNVSQDDIRITIESWPMLCARNATVLWTRGDFEPDLRPTVRRWVEQAGFEEVAFEGAPEKYGVGMARMTRDPIPWRADAHFFQFLPEKVQPNST